MRVTSEFQYQQALQNIQSNYSKITTLQNQISSGKRVVQASDDPNAMSQIMANTDPGHDQQASDRR
jgi:flagellin-like hook-associated protein FlgL